LGLESFWLGSIAFSNFIKIGDGDAKFYLKLNCVDLTWNAPWYYNASVSRVMQYLEWDHRGGVWDEGKVGEGFTVRGIASSL
jgi:hypothetical protein